MRKSVDELVAQAGCVLAELGYAPSTIRRYATTWNKVRCWCSQHGIERFGAEQEQHVIQGLGFDGGPVSTPGREALRHIRTLLSVDEEGAVPAVSRSAPGVPERFGAVLDAYAAHLEGRHLATSTRRGQLSVIRKFLAGVVVADIGDLSVGDVAAHMETCSQMAAQTRAQVLYRLFTMRGVAGV